MHRYRLYFDGIICVKAILLAVSRYPWPYDVWIETAFITNGTCIYCHGDINSIIDDQWHSCFSCYEEQAPKETEESIE